MRGLKIGRLATVVATLFLTFTSWSFAGEPLITGIGFCTNGKQVMISCPNPGQPFYGQDGCHRNGQARSFTKLGTGGVELSASATEGDGWCMTRDNVTGLVWEIKTAANMNDTRTWSDAQIDCNALEHGGFSDWRLPTVKELSTLVDAGIVHPGPTIDTDYFPRCKGNWYWSSSSVSDPGLAGNAWYVRFSNGYLSHAEKVGYKYVRAVRAGHPGYFEHSFVVGDGTVTDTGTGLMWQQATMEGTFTWEGALSACENLVLGGHRDWRLPNRNELLSLVDYSAYNPSIDAGVFSDTVSDRYWTSSPYATDSGEAWAIRFDSGALTTLKVFKAFGVGNLYRVRAVRTAQGGPAKALPSVIMLLLD